MKAARIAVIVLLALLLACVAVCAWMYNNAPLMTWSYAVCVAIVLQFALVVALAVAAIVRR